MNSFYAAFNDVPKPLIIEGCPCCLDEKTIAILLSKPLRELSPEDLSFYIYCVFRTVSCESDFLYFLPRIIEGACTSRSGWTDIPIIGQAIAEIDLLQWTDERRTAMMHVLCAVIEEALDDDDNGADIVDDWICAISKMRWDVAPFLARVETSPTHLLSYYESNSRALIKNKLGNAFWDREDSGFETVLTWFQSPSICKIISDAYGF